jgi:hypothetical protein
MIHWREMPKRAEAGFILELDLLFLREDGKRRAKVDECLERARLKGVSLLQLKSE